MFESEEEEISERVYNPDEDDYIIKTRDINITETKTKTKPKTENNVYSEIKYELKNVMKNLGIK